MKFSRTQRANISTISGHQSRSKSRYWLVALASAAAASAWYQDHSDACGIIGYVGGDEALPYLLEGLTILQNRGYDSAGVATLDEDGKVVVTKYASVGSTSDCIDLLKDRAPPNHIGHGTGIGHTRWATHGGKTDENAHPHTDTNNRVSLVHNGTIENCSALRDELIAHGIVFSSQTDTEVIAQLIGHHLDQGLELMPAIKKTLSRLEGTWGLCIISNDMPGQLIAARNGSPLVVGIDQTQKRMFVASEVSAFSRHTSQFVSLRDGEIAIIRPENFDIDMTRVQKAPKETIELSPAPYPHWTIKEIYEQPQAVARTLNYGGRFGAHDQVKLGGLDDNRELVLGINNVLISGCGTSLFAGMYGAKIFRHLNIFNTVSYMDAAEVTQDAFPRKDAGLMVLSQSGETKDTHRTLTVAQSLRIPQFSLVNRVGSLIARTTGMGVYLNAGRENGVASTKAFTTQVTALSLVAGWYAQNRKGTSVYDRKQLIQCLQRLPIYTGITLKTHEQVKQIAQRLKESNHMFVLGKGLAEPIAYEGALKIKEITYIHAEGFSGGALKHGPFALLEEGTPVVLLVLNDQHKELMKIAAQEVRARGAYNIIITDMPDYVKDVADEILTIPENGPLTALLGTIPLQLLAYELALARGINPDKPKNLAKAVTCD